MAGAAATPFLTESLVLLGAATIAVPLFKRLGLGSILGYLAAGIVIGPLARFITQADDISHVAELGIVLLLFIIGLELKPSLLWSMKRSIFVNGSGQVLVSAAALFIAPFAFGFSWQASLIIGLALALSSTAIVLQILEERDDQRTEYGRNSFAILLFQDLAIVPILAIVSLVAPIISTGPRGLSGLTTTLGAVIFIILIGRYALNPLFRLLARSEAREIMSAAALFVVLGAAWIMQLVGLSMALGAFVAGVMMAESSFRHQIEADIEPFRGLLMGLFFLSVGLSVNINVLIENWLLIVTVAPLIMIVKAAIIYALLRLQKVSHNYAVETGLLLAQCGEFAFVIFGLASSMLLITDMESSILIALVTVTMAITPLFILVAPKLMHGLQSEVEDAFDHRLEKTEGSVILVGFGRFGQIVAQTLLARDIDVTIIDADPNRIRQAATFGFKIYYGDGRRIDVLRAAGAEKAEAVVLCTKKSGIDATLAIFQSNFPKVKTFARAYDRAHHLELYHKNVTGIMRETLESALKLGRMTLEGLDFTLEEAQLIEDDVRARDAKRFKIQSKEGIHAGHDLLHGKAITPEPLTRPYHKAESLSPETERIATGDREDNT